MDKNNLLANRLLVNKVIYAKRVPTTNGTIRDIFQLEIDTHLRNNPDLEFKEVGGVAVNENRSRTYTLVFAVRNPVVVICDEEKIDKHQVIEKVKAMSVVCPKENYEVDGEDVFQRCSNCDGHDACADFGCAIIAGII